MFRYWIGHVLLELSACISRSKPVARSITATWSLLLNIDSKGSPLCLILPTLVCVSLDEPEPVDSALTFPSEYDTLEYSWVKATAVSVRLRIYSWCYKVPTDMQLVLELQPTPPTVEMYCKEIWKAKIPLKIKIRICLIYHNAILTKGVLWEQCSFYSGQCINLFVS